MTREGNTIIESLGIYIPSRLVSTRDMVQACKNKIRFPLEQLTGIENRPMAEDTEFSIDIAIKAVDDCFLNSKYNRSDVDLLICCNISKCDEKGSFSFEPSTS